MGLVLDDLVESWRLGAATDGWISQLNALSAMGLLALAISLARASGDGWTEPKPVEGQGGCWKRCSIQGRRQPGHGCADGGLMAGLGPCSPAVPSMSA